VVYGEKKTKQLAILLLIFTCIPIAVLFSYPALSDMRYYFYFALIVLAFVSVYLWKSKTRAHYRTLHNTLKLLLFIGVLCLPFIDTSLLLDKLIDILN
jgi:4-hydroxybenzoate polyprenyltransferase